MQAIVKELFGKEPHKGVNPDEVVAVGAAIQAGVLAGEVKDLLLLDVTPLSLGIETMGGIMTPLIQRNTTIPTRKSEVFSTASDNQTSVEVHVVQGERPLARDNRTLGRFHLVGLPPAPRGVPQIEVTFDIDANGIVNVSAKDLGTQKEQKITITASSGLSKDEVERMMREAESHSDEDKKRREEIEIRNRADQSIYTAERMLKDAGEKIPIADKNAIENAMADLKKAIEGNDSAAMSSAMDALMQAQHKASEALYKNQQADAGPGGAQGATGAQGAHDGAQCEAARSPKATSSTPKWWRTRRSRISDRASIEICDRPIRDPDLNRHGFLHCPRRRTRRAGWRHQAGLQAARPAAASGHQSGRPRGGGSLSPGARRLRNVDGSGSPPPLRRRPVVERRRRRRAGDVRLRRL